MTVEEKIEEVITRLDGWQYLKDGEAVRGGDTVEDPDGGEWQVPSGSRSWTYTSKIYLPIKRRIR